MSETERATRHDVYTNIEPDTESFNPGDAKEKALNFLGHPPPRKTCGFQVLVAIYTRDDAKLKNDDGSDSLIVAPSTVSKEDRFRSCTGMVVQMGSEAYQGIRFENSGPWCKIGDWVQIGRHDGLQIDYRGRPVMLINDDKIGLVLDEPTQVQRGAY